MAHKSKCKKTDLAAEVARLVGAGKTAELPTVDFSDPNRPKTCLEVDFPILPVNQIATIEGNVGKPIYQMSKWWARRRSSVFRAMLIAAATKAPDDPKQAAKLVWDSYYHNHQKGGAFKHLKVADIFMGGGTTIVEGSRLGMQMFGCDLNPIAWFITKNELASATVKKEDVQALLDDIEAEVKPQVMPFYSCDCPRGHKGKWIRIATGEEMKEGFDPLLLKPQERKTYRYEGPEIIYVFWAKHGPCSATKCGHRTPLMSTPVMAVKELSIGYWEHACCNCQKIYDIENGDVRMAPSVPLVVTDGEKPFAVLGEDHGVKCPHCGHEEVCSLLAKNLTKRVSLTLLVHPSWMAGSPNKASNGQPFGGSITDDVAATIAWNKERADHLQLVEVRGVLPEEVVCPSTRKAIKTGKGSGTVTHHGNFVCGKCGTEQAIVDSVERTHKTAPIAMFAIQGYCPECATHGVPYHGRFFSPPNPSILDAAMSEWESCKETDLNGFWPHSEIPFGHMTHQRQPLPKHGYTHWWMMFNWRQLLVHARLLRAIGYIAGDRHNKLTREFVLGAFQQYLRNQCMFSFWHMTFDKLAPALSNANFHPKSTVIEVGVFPPMGYGPWTSTVQSLFDTAAWSRAPTDLVSKQFIKGVDPQLAEAITGMSIKAGCGDPVLDGQIVCCSNTELASLSSDSWDIVITDPPFANNLHYSELSDFFHVWLRLILKDKYPDYFNPEYTPKTLEAVSNQARHPEDADAFFQRVLTKCWKSAHRILKPGGLLAFTFHHSEDEPWVQVSESLFDANFVLVATYPIRSDEIKGAGEFGSKKIEYDIIHVCRKRTEEPKPISWDRMQRDVINDVLSLESLIRPSENKGLLPADLQIIKRGKVLEHYSRHYGQVFDEGRPLSVKAALLGISQVTDKNP